MLGIKILEGKVITNITISENKEEVNFICDTGEKYLMHHTQD